MTEACSPTETFICRSVRSHPTLYALVRLVQRNKVPQQHNTIETTSARKNKAHTVERSAFTVNQCNEMQ